MRLPAAGVRWDGFSLRLQYNPGAAFGWGDHHAALFGLVTIAFVGYCGIVARRRVKAGTAAGLVPMALMCGGAAGNLLDRLTGAGHGPLSGSVADWMHVPGYPFAFNLADLALRVGALGLMLSLWRASAAGSDDRGPTTSSRSRSTEGALRLDHRGSWSEAEEVVQGPG